MYNWDQDITEIQDYFKDFVFPTEPIVINDYSTITGCELFYSTNLAIAQRNNGKPWFKPYIERLLSLKCYFETGRESLPELIFNPLKNHV